MGTKAYKVTINGNSVTLQPTDTFESDEAMEGENIVLLDSTEMPKPKRKKAQKEASVEPTEPEEQTGSSESGEGE